MRQSDSGISGEWYAPVLVKQRSDRVGPKRFDYVNNG